MSQGTLSRAGMDVTLAVGSGFEYLNSTLTSTGEILDNGGLRGTREHDASRATQGLIRVAGSMELQPAPDDLAGAAGFLQWIMGGTPSGTSYPLADTLTSRYVVIDKIADVPTFKGVYVNKATFKSSEGLPMNLTLDLIGFSEGSVSGSTFTAGAPGTAGSFPTGLTYNLVPPFMFFQSVLTLVTASRQVKDWTLVIDNKLDVQFNNSQTATRIQPADREITFSCTNPFTSAELALYRQTISASGPTATLVCTMGAKVLTFTFGALHVPSVGPAIPGRREITIKLDGVARAVGLDSGSVTPSLATTLALS